MQKKPQQISYTVAKTSFGIYLVSELREACGKEFPTETDVKKFLLRVNPSSSAAELQTARQVSRYCQTNKDYLREAREETLDKVAKVLNTPIKNFEAFREKINPLLKAFKYYTSYINDAEQYLAALDDATTGETKTKFWELFDSNGQTGTFLSMISYHFGEENKDLPAISFGAESDLRTERILTDLFDEYGLPAPQYIASDVFFEALDKQTAKTNFIAIGLFGNRLTAWMGSRHYLTPALEILPAEKCIRLNDKIYYANRSAGTDYALFCKIKTPHKSTVFIIGGIEGFGTQRLGEYFENNWPGIHAQTAAYSNVTLLFETGKDVKLVDTVVQP